jgi:predicted esterase
MSGLAPALLPVVLRGPAPHRARAVVVLVHGRGSTAQGILQLADPLGARDLAFVAPQAAQNSWYPKTFLAPLRENEPALTTALLGLGELRQRLVAQGAADERLVWLGFSQGACLALELCARNPSRYGGIVGFSGGLIGPPGTAREYPGSLAGTPVFLGCSDVDPHIPLDRVQETAVVLGGLGAAVTTRIYPGMGHEINADEIEHARRLLAKVGEGDTGQGS